MVKFVILLFIAGMHFVFVVPMFTTKAVQWVTTGLFWAALIAIGIFL